MNPTVDAVWHVSSLKKKKKKNLWSHKQCPSAENILRLCQNLNHLFMKVLLFCKMINMEVEVFALSKLNLSKRPNSFMAAKNKKYPFDSWTLWSLASFFSPPLNTTSDNNNFCFCHDALPYCIQIHKISKIIKIHFYDKRQQYF